MRDPRGANSKFPLRSPKPGNHDREIKCFTCNQRGHERRNCPTKLLITDNAKKPLVQNKGSFVLCAFCKKPGYHEGSCYTKARSESRNERND